MVNSGLATDHGLAVCFGSTAVERTVGLTVTVEVPRVVVPGSAPERRNIS